MAIMAVRRRPGRVHPGRGGPDPTKPAPIDPPEEFASLADFMATTSATQWLWESWIPKASIFGIAAPEGTGKTRYLMDLVRRMWFKFPNWPDGQIIDLPAKTPTLRVCGDDHQRELADIANSFGVPLEAIRFATPKSDPGGGTSLDNEDLVKEGGLLERAVAGIVPGMTIIDTLTYSTTKDLCSQIDVAELKKPLSASARNTACRSASDSTSAKKGRPSAGGSRAWPGRSIISNARTRRATTSDSASGWRSPSRRSPSPSE